MRRTRRLPSLLALVAIACGDALPLPERPTGFTRPTIRSSTPSAAFAGDVLELDVAPAPAERDTPLVGFPSGALVPLDRSEGRFRVRVPDDAGQGPLSLVTAGGRSVSSVELQYRGLGRLRRRQESRRYQTTLTVIASTVFDDGTELELFDAPAGFLVRSPGVVDRWMSFGKGFRPTFMLAETAEGPWIAYGEAQEGGPCEVDTEGYNPMFGLYQPFDGAGANPPGLLRAICLPTVHPEFEDVDAIVMPVLMPVGPSKYVFGVVGLEAEPISRAWLIDAAASTFEPIPAASDLALVDVLKGPGDAFTLLTTEFAHVVPVATPGAPAQSLALSLREAEKATSGLWVDDRSLAYGTTRGAIRLAQPMDGYTLVVDDIPPPSASIGQNPRVTILAISDDREILLALHQERGLVRTFDLGQGALPVTALPVDGPFSVVDSADGTFRICATNTVLTVSQEHGGVIDSAWTSSRLGSPTFAPSRCNPSELRLFVGAATIGEIQERDRRTMLPSYCPLEADPPGAVGRIIEFAANPSSGDLYAAYEGVGLVRFSGPTGAATVHTGYLIGVPGDPLERAAARRLHLSADGATFVASEQSRTKVLVYDTARFEEGPALGIDAPVSLVRPLVDGDTIVLLDREKVLRYDASEARAGRLVKREPDVELPDPVWSADVHDGVLFVATRSFPASYLRIDLSTGALESAGAEEIGLPYVSDLVLSPSGREAYVLFRDYDLTAWLHIVSLVPEIVGASSRLILPRQQGEVVTQLAISPDGEQLVGADIATNRLVIIE